jgi:hypothetical protein
MGVQKIALFAPLLRNFSAVQGKRVLFSDETATFSPKIIFSIKKVAITG